ncbi:transcription termination/antitermination protein NusG [Marinovum algicola]|uniref:transcription termination/antitermination protein NusG n=1 Tax=Marinovum algicola TaxID=42444 RepID=UPI0024BB8D77|nr:transcription termination/antitermination NusG family protein [Marinovum algicola]
MDGSHRPFGQNALIKWVEKMAFGEDLTDKTTGALGSDAAPRADNWFVAQLKPNGLALALRNLGRQRFATFVPERFEALRGATVRRPLFPGYMFVRFDPVQHGWQAINSTRGVTRLLLNDPRRPSPLPAQFMAGLIARCDDKGLVLPPEDFAAGDRIRVISGPFADLVTKVDALDKEDRLRVLIELMGQKVKTSIPRVNVEKLA